MSTRNMNAIELFDMFDRLLRALWYSSGDGGGIMVISSIFIIIVIA